MRLKGRVALGIGDLLMTLPSILRLLKCMLGELWSSQCVRFLQVRVMFGHSLEEFGIDIRGQFVDCDCVSAKLRSMSADVRWDECFGLSEYDCPDCVRAEHGVVSFCPAEDAGVIIVRAVAFLW